MPNRFSLRTRPIFDDNEGTFGGGLQKGVGSAIEGYLKLKELQAQEQNQVGAAGGTMEPSPSASDRWNSRPTWLGGRGDTVMQAQPMGGENVKLPPNVTPYNPDPRAAYGRGGGSFVQQQPPHAPTGAMDDRGETFGGSPQPGAVGPMPNVAPRQPQGVAPALNQMADNGMYEYNLPSGRKAMMPRPTQPPTRAQMKAAVDKARAGDPSDLYALDPSLISHDETMFPKRPEEFEVINKEYKRLVASGVPPAQASRQAGQAYGKSEPMDATEWDRRNAVTSNELDRRVGMREEAISGREAKRQSGDLTAAQSTARGKALQESGQKIMDGATEGEPEYEQGRAMRDQGLKLLGAAPPDPSAPSAGMRLRRTNASIGTVRARRDNLAAELRKRYPKASEQAIRQGVAQAMSDEGWSVQK
jgi:hypothetical protein